MGFFLSTFYKCMHFSSTYCVMIEICNTPVKIEARRKYLQQKKNYAQTDK